MPSPPARVRRLLCAHLGVAGLAFAAGVALLVRETGQHGHDWSELVYSEHARTVMWHQVRLIPAYGLLALAATALTWPLFRRLPPRPWLRLFAETLAADVVLLVLCLGPFFDRTPGQLAAVAAAVTPIAPSLDLHNLYHWHVLTGALVGFWAVMAWVALDYARLWWSGVRASQGLGRAARLAPAAALATAGLATAFVAKWGAPDAPVCAALLAEMDALPEIGHACGHSLSGPASLLAAAGLAAVVPSDALRLQVVGCPAEETGIGTRRLAAAGVFVGGGLTGSFWATGSSSSSSTAARHTPLPTRRRAPMPSTR